MSNKAIVLLSGGQDSTTCLFWAKAQGFQVEALTLFYGQRHERELEAAAEAAAFAQVPHQVLDMPNILRGSALVGSGEVDAPHPQRAELPASFTPARNILFLAVAANYAFVAGARAIVIGVSATDYSGYPDCRPEFIVSMARALQLGMGMEPEALQLLTPLLYLDKARTWKMAKDMGQSVFEFVRDRTLTDYNGDETPNEWGMGKLNNPASRLRAQGYFTAKEFGWI